MYWTESARVSSVYIDLVGSRTVEEEWNRTKQVVSTISARYQGWNGFEFVRKDSCNTTKQGTCPVYTEIVEQGLRN